jgi:hypothetical protein
MPFRTKVGIPGSVDLVFSKNIIHELLSIRKREYVGCGHEIPYCKATLRDIPNSKQCTFFGVAVVIA